MTLDEIVLEIKDTYPEHDELESIVDRLTEYGAYSSVAEQLCENEFGNNKQLSKKIFEFALIAYKDKTAECMMLIESILSDECLADKDWAMKIINTKIDEAKTVYDFEIIATTIVRQFDDKDWARKIYQKALDVASSEEFFGYQLVAQSIYNDMCDLIWAKEVYLIALEKYPEVENYVEVAELAAEDCEVCYNDKLWAKNLFEQAFSIAKTSSDYLKIANAFVDSEVYSPENDEDEAQRIWLDDLYVMALILEEDKDNKKYIKKDMKERGTVLNAKFIKDRGAELIKNV